jgi:hypothetical protein
MSKAYLERFFEEKDLAYESWSIASEDGTEHLIDTDYVIESIFATSKTEQTKIADTIRKIDFANGNVNHYLKFLAGVLVKNY